jgi:formylglycine-generating enzyme required for sulfatase activity
MPQGFPACLSKASRRGVWHGSRRSQEQTWPVGSLKPNDFGLFDVQGSVFTWCQESYRPYLAETGYDATEDREDGLIVVSTSNRVLRGGSFNNHPGYVRSAYHNSNVPTDRNLNNGCRPARTIAP